MTSISGPLVEAGRSAGKGAATHLPGERGGPGRSKSAWRRRAEPGAMRLYPFGGRWSSGKSSYRVEPAETKFRAPGPSRRYMMESRAEDAYWLMVPTNAIIDVTGRGSFRELPAEL